MSVMDRKKMELTQQKLARLQEAMTKAKEFLESGGDLDSQDAVPLSHELLDATDDMAEALARVSDAPPRPPQPAEGVATTAARNGT
jgi:hypothetical protein